MKPPNHLHRYRKTNLSKRGTYIVYKCQKPTCSHYIPIELAEGKLCECNRCHEPMVITKVQLNGSSGKPMAKPHCNNCIKRKNADEVKKFAEILIDMETTNAKP